MSTRTYDLRVLSPEMMKRCEELNKNDDGAWGWAHVRGLTLNKTWVKMAAPKVPGLEVPPDAFAPLWWGNTNGLRVCMTWCIELDGKRWIHVSLSRPASMPSYEDMAQVKRAFIGAGKMAYQLFVPEAKHISTHDYCLHLWHCVDGDVTPDFTRGTNQI